MFLLEPVEAARRTRAALGYAAIEVKESGERVGIHRATMARIVSPTDPRGFKSIEEAWQIADACGVPRSFMEYGFAIEAGDETRDQTARDQIATLSASLLSLRLELEELRDTGRPRVRPAGEQ